MITHVLRWGNSPVNTQKFNGGVNIAVNTYKRNKGISEI